MSTGARYTVPPNKRVVVISTAVYFTPEALATLRKQFGMRPVKSKKPRLHWCWWHRKRRCWAAVWLWWECEVCGKTWR